MGTVISYNGKLLVDSNGHAFKYGNNSGTININTNGIHDIDGFANANVNIPTGPAKSKANVTISGTTATAPAGLYNNPFNIAASELCTLGTKSITANGTGIDVTGYSKVNVNVGPPPVPVPSSHTPGDIITWDDKEWLVCHYDSTNNRVYLIAKDIVSMTTYGTYKPYYRSTLNGLAAIYQIENMSAAALAECVDVTIDGFTAKVFIPSKEQMQAEYYPNQGFSWFNSDEHRKATYSGSAEIWWTSTPDSSVNVVWHVNTAGGIHYSNLDKSRGFRPCVCVQL